MKFLLPVILLIQLGCAPRQAQRNGPDRMAEKLTSGRPLLIEKQVFDEDLDLLAYLEAIPVGKGLYQASTISAITFRDCTFKGMVSAFSKKGEQRTDLFSFGNAVSFLNCRFEKEVNFRGASFHGRVDFSGSVMDGLAVFEGASFLQSAWFTACLFRGEARFQQVFFHEKANFLESEFSGNAGFQGTTFGSEAQFSVVKFLEYADFSLISSRAPVYFNYSEFSGRTDFTDATFGHDLHFNKTKLGKATFERARFLGRVYPEGFFRENPVQGNGMEFLLDGEKDD